MTINEIQSTLDTLRIRHQGLDEALLTTLLTSSGWENKEVEEAVTLFRGKKIFEKPEVLIEEKIFLPEVADTEHMLVGHSVKIKEEKSDQKNENEREKVTEEPQSLIVPPKQPIHKKTTDFPDNLPLRPFDSSHHVWPFSRYKDVFYGEVMPDLSKEDHTVAKQHKVEHIHLEEVPLTKKDEKLIVLASMMLLVILLLLGYMYSNGRL